MGGCGREWALAHEQSGQGSYGLLLLGNFKPNEVSVVLETLDEGWPNRKCQRLTTGSFVLVWEADGEDGEAGGDVVA